MNPSHILRLTGILAGLAAACAVGLSRATVTAPVLLPLDRWAPPVLPGRIIPLS
jgi:hypothetical protein